MPVNGDPHRLLRRARQLVGASSIEEILETACSELRELGGYQRALAACSPGGDGASAVQVEHDTHGKRRANRAASSALFALHRRVSLARGTVVLERTAETDTIFEGLACGRDEDVITAWPIVHRTRRIFGELVVIGRPPSDDEHITTLVELTTVALENAHRLAFARRDQDRLLLISEATSDALYDWNFDTRDFWWGGGIVKLFGDGDVVETTPRWKLERIHPSDRDRVRKSLEAARFSLSQTWASEYRFQRADGSLIDVEDRGYFLRETDGRAYRMVGSMHDITALKGSLIREQQARQDAEASNRAKDEFLAMLGHELRNPLAPIVSGLQLMRLRGPQKANRELDVLERQAQHLTRLVDDLLDISRITHGKIELKKTRLDVAALLATAIETAGPIIESRRHTLEIAGTAQGLFVDGDRARLGQAISNLLVNAAKYTEPGGTITVTTRSEGTNVVISVRDTGIGIAPELLPTIFQMFVQDKQALDRAQGGLGLGLTIVHSMVTLHGGTVSAHSEGRGRGTEFTIRLPQASRMASPVIRPGTDRDEPTAGLRILVVDDNTDAADLLSILLERLGNTTRVAHDARDALRVIDEFVPELAVLDIGLPEIDGYELARRLRAHPLGKGVRLIALSGYGQASDRERSADAGFDAHLVKPVIVESLKATIAKLVG